jgi:hypothetical protein
LAGRIERLRKMVQSGFIREELPPAPPPAPGSPRSSLLRVLFEVESLPDAPSGPSGDRRSLLSVLLSRESLPVDPERKRTHRDWLSFLFAPERIDPPGGPGPEAH